MSDQTLSLGDAITHNGQPYRVVRIIRGSTSLFEPDDGSAPYVIEESYLELKGGDGNIDFLILTSEKRPYEGQPCIIKGLTPLMREWRDDK